MPEEEDSDEDDAWLHANEGYIHFFVHKATRRCGIHIRGISDMCGVDESTIRSAIQKAEKAGGGLREIRETPLSKILKDMEIFSRRLAGNKTQAKW